MAKMGFNVKLGREVVDPDARQGLGSKEDCEKYLKRAKTLLNEEQAKYLDKMEDGLTGLVAEIDTKKPGKLVAFRFDIDGVDVTECKEETHRPFKDGFRADIDGITHACGHDGHITIGLFTAKLISENLDLFSKPQKREQEVL